MSEGIIAKKVGMTRIFTETGQAIPVTVLQAGPCTVTEVRTMDRDGYEALQLGFGERKEKNTAKPQVMDAQAKNIGLSRTMMEFRGMNTKEIGDVVDVSLFSEGDTVKTRSKTKGRGFAGVMKRHNFKGGPASHGASKFHRAPGSHGNRMTPGLVFKGIKQAGHMGDKYRTTKGLSVVRVDADKNLLFVQGAVSGPNGGIVKVMKMG